MHRTHGRPTILVRKSRHAKAALRPAIPRTIAMIERLEPRQLLAAVEPIINEFMASNKTGITDGFGDNSDWIEIYNPTALPVSMLGWHLTNDITIPNEWTFPNISINPNSYLIVWASARNLTDPSLPLHTDFKLDPNPGEYLALTRPDNTVATQFTPTYPRQLDDTSYGLNSAGTVYQYMTSETPGAVNIDGANGLVEDTKFSVDRGLFNAPFDVALTTLTSGATIRYTTNGSPPTATTGTVYTVPIHISATTTLRAAAFKTGYISTDVDTETYLFLNDIIHQPNLPISSITRSGTVATVTTPVPHGFANGATVLIYGANQTEYNTPPTAAPFTITGVPSSTTFTYTVASTAVTPATGTTMRIANPVGYPGSWGTYNSGTIGPATADYEMDPDVYNDPSYANRLLGALSSIPSVSIVMPSNDLFNNTNSPDGTGGIYSYSLTGVDNDVPLKTITSITRSGAVATATLTAHGYVNGDRIWISNANQADFNGTFTIFGVTTNTFQYGISSTAPASATGSPIYAQKKNTTQLWERAASVELINPDGSKGFQINAGVQIQGGASREPSKSGKHSFRLLFKTIYGDSSLNYPLFDDSSVTSFDSLILKAGFNNSWVHWDGTQRARALYVHDQWASDTQLAMGDVSKHGRFVQVYLNGVYWGLYDLMERPENSFASSYLGGPKEDYDVVDNVDTLIDGNMLAFNTLKTMLDGDMTVQANYDAVKQYLDLPSFADYVILMYYGGNNDWTDHNWYAARRSRVDGVPANVDGFHFFSFDSERILEGTTDNITANDVAGQPSHFYQRLRTNPEFRQLFADRLHALLFNDGALSPGANAARLRAELAKVDPAVIAESARWGDYRKDVNFNVCSGCPAPLYTRDNQWLTEQNRILQSYFPIRGFNLLNVFRNLAPSSLYPNMDAPEFSKLGGNVSAGFSLSMTNLSGGTVYYTLNGSDPRLVGGAVAPGALTYTTSITINASEQIKARVFNPITNVWSALTDYKFFVDAPPALRITEMMYNPKAPVGSLLDDDEFQFIELQNTGGTLLNLNGYVLEGVNHFVFPNITLGIGARTLVVANQAAFESRYGTGLPIAGVFTGRLSHGGEKITLLTPLGQIIEQFIYKDGWYGPTDGDGFSLVAVDATATDAILSTQDGWRPSTPLYGAPGAADPGINHNSIVFNEVLPNTSGDPWIEFKNQTAGDINIGGWFLTDNPLLPTKYVIPAGTTVPANSYLRLFQSATFGPTFILPPNGGELKLSSNIGAALGSYRDGVDFGAADPEVSFGRYIKSTGGSDFVAMTSQTPNAANSTPVVGPVVINEVMYNPFNNADEFIEIRNISGGAVALHDGTNGWAFTAGVSFSFPLGASLGPGEIALIVPIDPAVFRTKYSIPAPLQIFGPYTGTLSNNGEKIALGKPVAVPPAPPAPLPYIQVDRVNYNDSGSWPILANGIGPSLQRINGTAYTNDAANWSASANGGTPGLGNVLRNAPSITPLADANTNEGTPYVASGSFTDADAGDTWSATVYWGDSGLPQTLTLNANKTFSLNHTYVDSGVFTVIITITDGGKLFGTDTFVVTVNNVAPNGTVAPASSVNEGASGTINISARTDVSTTDVSAGYFLNYDFNNDGVFETTNAVNASAAFTVAVPAIYFTDGPGTRIVKVRLIDKDGGFRDFTPTFTVNNVAPTATFGNSGPVNEGTTTASVSFTAQSDVAADLPTLTYAYDMDNDGTFEITGSSSPTATIPANITAENGTRTIRGRVTDKDGGSTIYQTTITINNVAPTAALGNSGPVPEGSSGATVSFSGQVDSPGDTAAGFTYSYDFNNDAVFEITGSSSSSATVPASFLVDGPATKTIHARITDRDGGFTDYTTPLIVNNVNPTISAIADKMLGMGTPMSASGSVSDPGTADTTFTATVDYGAGGGQQPLTINPDKTFSLNNTYNTPGFYTVTVRVTDKDGGAATPRTFTVNVRGSSLVGTAAADTYYIRLDAAHANVEFYENTAPPGAPTFVIPVASLTSISVDGQGGDDVLSVDFGNTNPIPSGGLSYSAGAPSASDALILIGDGSLAASEILSATTGSGTINIGGRSIGHSGVESITASQLSSLTVMTPLASDNVTFTLSSGQTTISGTSGGTTLPAVQVGTTGTFILDAASNEGAGDDTFTINSAGSFGGGSTMVGIAAGTGNNTLVVNGGSPNLDTNYGGGGANLAVTVNNSAVVNMGGSQTLKSLTINGSGRVNVPGASGGVLRTSGLSLQPNAVLDLNGNDMIVQATAGTRATMLNSIGGWIRTARATSPTRWLGKGITSSVAAADATRVTGLAAILNETSGGGSVLYPTFDSQSVDINSILIKYTYDGDANVNGHIEPDDFAAIDGGFISHANGYGKGDFDYSGTIDSDDYFTIDRAFADQGATLTGGSAAPVAQAAATETISALASAPKTSAEADPTAAPTIMPQRVAVKKSKHHRRKGRDDDRLWDRGFKSDAHAFPLRQF